MQEKHVRWREFLPLIIILFIASVAMILCDRPLARGDGLAYFIWLDSIAGDGDMDWLMSLNDRRGGKPTILPSH